MADVRVRFAQSLIRHDLTPSSWSSAALLLGDRLLTVPLDPGADVSSVPAANAIRALPLDAVDDPERYPNVAVIAFAAPSGDALADAAADVQRQRGLIDLPGLLVAWLGWIWGVDDANPLVAGQGVPSAAFVEAVHAVADIELTPGLASASSCPEAMRQSARWWGDYYREREGGRHRDDPQRRPRPAQVPAGAYAVRQPAARGHDPADRTDDRRRHAATERGPGDDRPGGGTGDRRSGGPPDRDGARRALRRHRGRLRVRRVGDDLPAQAGPTSSACSNAARRTRRSFRAVRTPSGARSGTRAKGCTGCTAHWWFDHIGAVVSSALGAVDRLRERHARKDRPGSSRGHRERRRQIVAGRVGTTSSRTTTAPSGC